MIARVGGAGAPLAASGEGWRADVLGVDRVMLGAVLALIGCGLIASWSASPTATPRFDLDDPFHFTRRHAVFAGLAMVTMLIVAALPTAAARRVAIVGAGVGVVALALTLAVGTEANGARRWLRVGGLSLQASEFAKPTLVVLVAWLAARGGGVGVALGMAVTAATVALMLAQPDVGQAALLAGAAFVTLFAAGARKRALALCVAAGAGAAAMAYVSFGHVRARVGAFLDPSGADTYQLDKAREAMAAGGLFGVGPGEGVVKHALPDAHTDFVFAVLVEEHGAVMGLAVLALFALVVFRALSRAGRVADPTARAAASGLAALVGGQALLNVAVACQAAPAKGVTLPFVSYGGSALVAAGLAAGLSLAFTRTVGPRAPT